MSATAATRRTCRVSTWLTVIATVYITAEVRGEQRGPVRLDDFAAPSQLSAPRVNVVSGAIAARLQQARMLAAAQNWNEAVEVFCGLASSEASGVVALEDGRYVSVGSFCRMQLSRLPPEGLEMYRRRVDATAERWYRGGISARDERQLARVVNELFCSRWGDDALLAMGEFALERGDYAAARRAWEQISPRLRDPSGRPLAWALRGIDFATDWDDFDHRWQRRDESPDWLAYPDTQIDLAEVRARLILVSIRADEFDRAALELEAFRRWHPQSVGRLAGQQGPLVPALETLLSAAREWKAFSRQTDWPTFAGAPSRSLVAAALGANLVPAWDRPVVVFPPPLGERSTPFVARESPADLARQASRSLFCFPAATDDLVFFADAVGIHAADLPAGRPALAADGLIYQRESYDTKQPRVSAPFAIDAAPQGVSRRTLNIVASTIFGCVGVETSSPSTLPEPGAGERLVGLDIEREGLLTFHARTDDATWSFAGAPVGDGRRLYVALRRRGATPQVAVACFDASTGSELWRTPVCSGDPPTGSLRDGPPGDLLTLVGDRVFYNTNLGVIAALDTEQGAVCWLATYARSPDTPVGRATTSSFHSGRDLAPCVYDDGMVIAAPADTASILALDAVTGKVIWNIREHAEGAHLLGVVGERLVVGGDRLASLDARTGHPIWIFPESPNAGVHGLGRGLIAGREIFWPTQAEIQVVDLESGQRTRPPISLSTVGRGGANLAAAGEHLIVAGYDGLMAYRASPEVSEAESQNALPPGGRSSDRPRDRPDASSAK